MVEVAGAGWASGAGSGTDSDGVADCAVSSAGGVMVATTGGVMPSSWRIASRRLCASTLAVACSTSSIRDSTDVSLSSDIAAALA